MSEENKKSITIKVPSFMEALVLILVVLVAANFYYTYNLYGITGKLTATGDQQQVQAPEEEQQEPAPTFDINRIDLSKAQVKGKSTAEVTIVEYSDFQCPYCSRAATGPIAQVIKDYVDTGKVRLVFRHFPLSFHQYALVAAEAAECAGDQGKFWEMHDKLFANQDALDTENLKKYASELGLDTSKFNTCLTSGVKQSVIQAEFNEGASFGVSGTPTFFVNGQEIVGAQPYSVFQQAIDAALA